MDTDLRRLARQHNRGMLRMFHQNRRSNYKRGLTDGMLDATRLAHVPAGSDTVFRRRIVARRRSWSVVIGVDVSGSTGSYTYLSDDHGQRMSRARLLGHLAAAQGLMLEYVNIPYQLCTHTTSDTNAYVFTVKGFDEDRLPDERIGYLQSLGGVAGNLDGSTLLEYHKMAARRRESDRLILYYTDGAMPAENFSYEVSVLMDEIDQISVEHRHRSRRTHLLAIALDCDDPLMYGMDTIVLDTHGATLESLVRAVLDGLRLRLDRPEAYDLRPPVGVQRQLIIDRGR